MFQHNANTTLFQHDNTTRNTARNTVTFLSANKIAFFNDWPAKSPDFNPIEHIWDDLDQRVRRRPISPSNVIQLRRALNQEGTTFYKPKSIHFSVLCANMLKVVIPGINLGFWCVIPSAF